MKFLTPWFLLGAAAVAGPILFHLIRQAVRDRMPFSSLMFLRPTPQKVTRRRKLENIWLLLLRCLCLLLLAAGFARPFFSTNNAMPLSAAEGRQLVLLVDTSASMRREDLWEKASALAGQYLDKTSPADQVAVLTFDRQPHTLVNFSEWSSWVVDQRAALARQRVATAAPGWMGTQIGLALTTAAEKFTDDSANEKPASRRELVLITDLQEGAKLDGLQGHDWPAGVKVIVERVEPKHHLNAGLGIASESGAQDAGNTGLIMRVTNARDSGQEKFKVGWSAENGSGFVGEPMEIYLPSGQSRNFPAPKIPADMAATQLRLTGDEEIFDNAAYYAAPEKEHTAIAYFGSESANDPAKLRYYLERVFPETPRRKVEIIFPTNQSALSPELFNQATFAVIPGRLTPEETTTVRNWLTPGKTALMVLADDQTASTLATLAGVPAVQMTEAGGDYALLGGIDFAHPLFAPFADPRFSDFTHIHFWKHRRWEIPSGVQAHVLAKFDDGSPALTQITVGHGNLLVLASGWNPADSQLAVSSKFPPLMQTMLDWSGAGLPERFQFQTGDAIPSPSAVGGATIQWQKPDGKKETLAADTVFGETDLPGIYTATVGDKQRRFAVNLPLDESRTAPLATDELARLGVPLQTPSQIPIAKAQEIQRQLQRAELENQQKIWRWLIAGVLAVMLGEIILGGWLARREKTIKVTT
jgi:Aerotolerance regulator N-terminal/von Willebrand factor type A domain